MRTSLLLCLILGLTLAGCKKKKLKGDHAFLVGNWEFVYRYNFATSSFEDAATIGLSQKVEFQKKGFVCWGPTSPSECSKIKFFNESVDANGDPHYGFDMEDDRFLEAIKLYNDTIILTGDVAASDDQQYVNYYARE